MKTVRMGAGSGYWGDLLEPAIDLAKRGELDYFASKGVWRVVPRTRANGQRVVGTRWVNCNKGDAARPEVRCRWVAQEVKTMRPTSCSQRRP